jgi:hypothetical protein
MKRITGLAVTLAMLLATTAAIAAQLPRDDQQAPRAQEQQAPRDRQDELQAPRG